MSVGLLDVNMLIALAWPSHVHHEVAQEWFAENASAGFATCPITQCGFVRLSSNPKAIREAVTPREAVGLLGQILKRKDHRFWPDDMDLLDSRVPARFLVGHRQVTDAYLLGLAIRRGGRLVTLDDAMSSLVSGCAAARQALHIVRPRQTSG